MGGIFFFFNGSGAAPQTQLPILLTVTQNGEIVMTIDTRDIDPRVLVNQRAELVLNVNWLP